MSLSPQTDTKSEGCQISDDDDNYDKIQSNWGSLPFFLTPKLILSLDVDIFVEVVKIIVYELFGVFESFLLVNVTVDIWCKLGTSSSPQSGGLHEKLCSLEGELRGNGVEVVPDQHVGRVPGPGVEGRVSTEQSVEYTAN